jgi:Ca2+-binding EF-hand superfamily protein
MKIEDYKRCMEIMVTAGPRVWAVCAFRFWDVDQNGLICTNDIFKIFKDLDQLENDLKQNNDDPNPKSLRMVI